jgi:hypothetical protein
MSDIGHRSTEASCLLQERHTVQDDNTRRSHEAFWGNLLWGCVGVAAGVLMMHVAVQNPTTAESTAAMMSPPGMGSTRTISSSIPPPSSSAPSPYSKFQALGFQIFTGGAPGFIDVQDDKGNNITISNPECEKLLSYGHLGGEIQCYVGHHNTKQDVEQRLAIMTAAVKRAYELSDKDPKTLKIFVAPEFFFRGPDGAYVYKLDHDYAKDDSCREICQLLTGLEKLVAHKRFEHWLFVFGTVIAAEILPKEDVWDYLFYNFAPIYKGYNPAKTDFAGKRFIVPKRYVSNLDFLTPRRHFNDSLAKELLQFGPPSDKTVLNPYDIHQKQYDRTMWHEYKEELDTLGYTMIEYDWMILDGITFSIEVCLDHDMKTALNTYLADAVKGSTTRIPSVNSFGGKHHGGVKYVPIPGHQAQISIVSSSGMTVNVDSMALADGGTIILQDGSDDIESSMTWEDECQQFSWHFDGGSEAVQRFGVVSPTEVLFEYRSMTDYQNHHVYDENEWQGSLAGVFSTELYPPKITVYNPSDIADV